ncbi:MAG: hypothetical protein KAH17_02760 [Bacteroidales bacterium]|nr:hypothetical protein [Bacteroidales bacterium]
MVRFLVLFSSDPIEASIAAQLVERLQRSFADVWTGLLIPEQNEWISLAPVKADEVLLFKKTPGEYRNQIRELLPDYLIDLSGEPRFWLFKKRTQLIHFSLKAKFVKANREIQEIEGRYKAYSEELDKLLATFDLAENDETIWKKVIEFLDK